MTQTPSEGAGTAGEPEMVPDEPLDPFAEDREVKQQEAGQRPGMEAAPPDQPWT